MYVTTDTGGQCPYRMLQNMFCILYYYSTLIFIFILLRVSKFSLFFLSEPSAFRVPRRGAGGRGEDRTIDSGEFG